MTKINFQGHDYDEATLKQLDETNLLKLRNIVASNMGVSAIKSFKDHDQAVEATWKALSKWDTSATAEEAGAATDGKTKPTKPKAEPKEPAEVKAAQGKTVKRPTRGMFRRIQKLVAEVDRCKRRWDNYKDGMTILDTHEGQDMTPLDVSFYVNNGFMKLIEPTEEEYEAGMNAWYEKHGIDNPMEAKKKKDAEREAAKAEKAAEREKAKAEREAAKAEKAAEREEAKAKREADKAAKAEAAEKAKAAAAAEEAKS